MSGHDVVIIGAGLAGLAAARRLREKGYEPLVLDKADGPGGRVRTDKVDGFLLDTGFQTLLTAFPEAQAVLDYDSLDLRPFDHGALVRVGDRFHRVADPFRSPGDAFASMRAPVGSMSDKLAMVRFRKSVLRGETDELFARKESTARERLLEVGISEKMIDRLLAPLLAAVALDPTLAFSSRYLEFMFRMLAEGEAAVPADGMGEIARQLADGLPAHCLRYAADVTAVAVDHVVVDGSRIDASAIIIATDASDAARLTAGEVEDRGAAQVTTWWFVAPEPPVQRPTIVLGGTGSAINSLAVMSRVSDRYSPDDRALIAAVTPGRRTTNEDVVRTLREWYGAMVDEWEQIRVDRIERARPVQPVGVDPDQTVRLASGMFVAGHHRQNASIDGALVSGRRAAEAVVARLCRDC